jgi:histidinol-phosphate/aromatic aminotransferase/cobyric acid decarboxylase-like protein
LLSERGRAAGLEPLPSVTNFLLLGLGGRIEPSELGRRLVERGFLVKAPLPAPLGHHIRVTLGPPDLMAQFADALDAALAG